MARLSPFAVILVGVTALWILPVSAQPRDLQDFGPYLGDFDEQYYRDLPPPREPRRPVGGTKYCSVYVPDNWRDSFPVPAAWRWSDCRDFARAIGATHVHFLCVFSHGQPRFSMGGPGDLPNPDCGWGEQRR